MALRELLMKFVTIAGNLNGKLVAVNYLSKLINVLTKLFDFQGFCGGVLQYITTIMYKLGHCGNDVRLRSISGHLEVRDF